jgi:hypothetical protein
MTRRLLPVLAAVLVALVALSAVALAAKPVKGAKYSGKVSGVSKRTTVSFKVSSTGRKVTGLKIKPSIPAKCSTGHSGTLPAVSAKIKRGKFKAKFTATVHGTKRTIAKVSGKFLSHRKERGTIKSFGQTSSCTKSFKYSTKAK